MKLCGLAHATSSFSLGTTCLHLRCSSLAGYEESLNAAEKSLRENASVPGVYRVRAAALSQLGRMDEARAALADFLRLVPDATVATTKAQVPLKRPGDLDRYIEALKRAGLPDS